MVIGVMGAMNEEISSLVDVMEGVTSTTKGSRTYHRGTLCDRECVVVFSHWGKVAAAITATSLITEFDLDEIVFTGVAGGIDPQLNIGDVVVGNQLYQHDMDASPIIERHEIPLLNRAHINAHSTNSKKLLSAVERFLADDVKNDLPSATREKFSLGSPSVVSGDIASGDQFVSDPAIAKELKMRLPTVRCVEMEGAAVAQVCESYDLPFAIVRTISDGANDNASVDFLSFVDEVAKLYSLGILKRYLTT